MSLLAHCLLKRVKGSVAPLHAPTSRLCRGFKWRRETHYAVLGVAPDASHAEIKAAYIALSKELHPDLNRLRGEKEGEELHKKYVKVTEAYSVLSNKVARHQYDIEVMMDHPAMKEKVAEHDAKFYKNYMPSTFQERARAYGFPEQDPDYYKKHGNYHHQVAMFCVVWMIFGVFIQYFAVYGFYNKQSAVMDLKSVENQESLFLVRAEAQKHGSYQAQADAFRTRTANQDLKQDNVK